MPTARYSATTAACTYRRAVKYYTTQAVFAVEQRMVAELAQTVLHTEYIEESKTFLRSIDVAFRCRAVLFLEDITRNLTTNLLVKFQNFRKTRAQ